MSPRKLNLLPGSTLTENTPISSLHGKNVSDGAQQESQDQTFRAVRMNAFSCLSIPVNNTRNGFNIGSVAEHSI